MYVIAATFPVATLIVHSNVRMLVSILDPWSYMRILEIHGCTIIIL